MTGEGPYACGGHPARLDYRSPSRLSWTQVLGIALADVAMARGAPHFEMT